MAQANCGCDCQTIAAMFERQRQFLDTKFLALDDRISRLEKEHLEKIYTDVSATRTMVDTLELEGSLDLTPAIKAMGAGGLSLAPVLAAVGGLASQVQGGFNSVNDNLNGFSMKGNVKMPKLDCLELLLQEILQRIGQLEAIANPKPLEDLIEQLEKKVEDLAPFPELDQILRQIELTKQLIRELEFTGEVDLSELNIPELLAPPVTDILTPIMEMLFQLRQIVTTLQFEGFAEVPDLTPNLAPLLELMVQVRQKLETLTFEGIAEMPDLGLGSIVELLIGLKEQILNLSFEGVAAIPDLTSPIMEMLTQIREKLATLEFEGVAVMPGVATAAAVATAIELATQTRNKLDNLQLEGIATMPEVATASAVGTAIELLTQIRKCTCPPDGQSDEDKDKKDENENAQNEEACIDLSNMVGEFEFPLDSDIVYSSEYQYTCGDKDLRLDYEGAGFCAIHSHLRTFYPIFSTILNLLCEKVDGKLPELQCLPVSSSDSQNPELPTYSYTGYGLNGMKSLVLAVTKQLEDVHDQVCKTTCVALMPNDKYEEFVYDTQLVITFGHNYPDQTGSLWHMSVPKPKKDLRWDRDFEPLYIKKGATSGRIYWENSKMYTGSYFDDKEEAERFLAWILGLTDATPSNPEKPIRTSDGGAPKRKPKNTTLRAVRAVIAEINRETQETEAVICLSPKGT